MKYALPLLLALLLGPVWAQPSHPSWPPATYMVYYGDLNPEAIARLRGFDLVIVHPGDERENLTPQKVQALKNGGKTIVIGYVSIGEDPQVPAGPPAPGPKQAGPSYFDQVWKTSDNDYPQRYLDQVRYHFTADGFVEQGNDNKPITEAGQDGLPDENGVWGSYYVRADDPKWRSIVYDKFDYLKSLGVDGYFLDTVDTASPWGEYGATRPGMLELVTALRARYPNQFLIANRGLFLLEDGPAYGQAVDGIMFESFLTLWNYATEKADRSPWLRWHVQALDDSVGPAAKAGAFHLFFLEYLSPQQPDLAL
ncbi:MAG: hypothetical protein KC910_05040, partial [Candidatus Eremiobacteraeota bacterium]|nr:hypothetical protein [Candidatus Eremiobacteraeota bacterium]